MLVLLQEGLVRYCGILQIKGSLRLEGSVVHGSHRLWCEVAHLHRGGVLLLGVLILGEVRTLIISLIPLSRLLVV